LGGWVYEGIRGPFDRKKNKRRRHWLREGLKRRGAKKIDGARRLTRKARERKGEFEREDCESGRKEGWRGPRTITKKVN